MDDAKTRSRMSDDDSDQWLESEYELEHRDLTVASDSETVKLNNSDRLRELLRGSHLPRSASQEYQQPRMHNSRHQQDQLPEKRREMPSEYRSEKSPEQYRRKQLPERRRESELPEQSQVQRLDSNEPEATRSRKDAEHYPRKGTLSALLRNSIVIQTDYIKNNLSRYTQLRRPISGDPQALGRGCCRGCDRDRYEQHQSRYEPTCSDEQHSCDQCYDNPPPRKPKRRQSCDACCDPAPIRCSQPKYESRRESECDCGRPAQAVPCRDYSSSSSEECCQVCAPRSQFEAPPPRSQSNYCGRSYSCEAPPKPCPARARQSESMCSCSTKIKYKSYAPSNRNSDYLEKSEYRNTVCRNPLVVKSRTHFEKTRPKRSYIPCDDFNMLPQTRSNCDCPAQHQPRPRARQEPSSYRRNSQTCCARSQQDYWEDERDECCYQRNQNSDRQQNYCNERGNNVDQRGNNANQRENYSRNAPVTAGNTTSNKTQRVTNRPKPKAAVAASTSRKSSSPSNKPPHLKHIQRFDRTCYVPPSCFAPRFTETQQGHLGSELTDTLATFTQGVRRRLQNTGPNALSAVPKMRRLNPNFKKRLSGCGLRNPRIQNVLLSRVHLGSGYNVTPLSRLSKLNLNWRAPKLHPSPSHPLRCCGGKLTPNSTRTLVARQREIGSHMATPRTTPQTAARSERPQHLTQTTAQPRGAPTPVRRDLPKRYQATPPEVPHRSIPVTQEQSRPAQSQRQPGAVPAVVQSRAPQRAKPAEPPYKKSVVIMEHNGNESPSPQLPSIRQAVGVRREEESGRTSASRKQAATPNQQSRDQGALAHEATRPSSTRGQPETRSVKPKQLPETARSSTSNSFPAPGEQDEQPQHSRSAPNEAETSENDANSRYYRGSFLTIRPTLTNEEPTRPSRKRGSLIMITANGMHKSMERGSRLVVPTWQCLGTRGGCHAGNAFTPGNKRNPFNWRKFLPNWLFNDKRRPTDDDELDSESNSNSVSQ
ncbi:hypothetical protein KR044_001321 [Drosophila immigrans]|nr:hypothetical protein KR044_001321 [Drosophila immigrans]